MALVVEFETDGGCRYRRTYPDSLTVVQQEQALSALNSKLAGTGLADQVLVDSDENVDISFLSIRTIRLMRVLPGWGLSNDQIKTAF